MLYNIYYEIASIFFVSILLIYLIYRYPNASLVNKRFRNLTTSVLIADLMDVISAVTISYPHLVPKFINLILAGSAYIATAFVSYCFVRYVDAFLKSAAKCKWIIKLNKIIACFFIVFNAGSIPFGYCFYFDENMNYMHGDLFVVSSGMLLYFIISGGFLLLINKKQLDQKQFYFTILFLVIAASGELIQMLFIPNQLVGLFATSLALFIILISLETPDYQALMDTMDKLEQAKNEADIANASKSRFLANMSHEIRTPINAIIGMNEMILREEKDEEIRQYATDVKNSSITLLGIINDILDTSKIESGKMELVPTKYDSKTLIKNIINMISYRAKEKNLRFDVQVDENIPSILYGDDVRLKQIIVNILTNAVKYTKEGSVTFIVNGTKEDDLYKLHVEVTDTGIGIKEENLDKIFDAFERVDESKNKYIEGTGLGMSITKQLITLMGSKIEVKSVYGEGSTFAFDVVQKIIEEKPIGNIFEENKDTSGNYNVENNFANAKDNAQGSVHSSVQESIQGNTKGNVQENLRGKILVVDDNELNRKVIIQLLKKTELTIKEASSGREALEIIENEHFDIILLDHMMPEMDGIETMTELKNSMADKIENTKVIVMTANSIVGAREEYMEVGFDDFISKPIFPEELDKLLEKWL